MSISTSLVLPVELIQEIIQSLVAPATNPLRYGNKADVVRTLRQLSLVSHFVYDMSVAYLYSSIELMSGSQLMDLISTLQSSPIICLHTHSLFLNFNFARSSLTTEVGTLLDLLSPHLRRLALCASRSMFKSSSALRPVLGRLTSLEDFNHVWVPCPELGDIWSNWTLLRRVLLVGTQVNKAFTKVVQLLPHLSHLCLIDACWGEEDDEYGLMLEMLDAGSGLQKVVLVFGSSEELVQFLQFVRSLPSETLQSTFREGLDVQYIERWVNLATLAAQVADGSFWELDTQDIVVHNKARSPCII